jgi:hypothetical protein
MYLKISNMFRTLICAVFSTTINKLSIHILLSDNLQAQQRLQAFPPVMPPACCGAKKAPEQ